VGDQEVELILEPVAASGGAVGREALDDRSLDVLLALGSGERGEACGSEEGAAERLLVRVLAAGVRASRSCSGRSTELTRAMPSRRRYSVL
jgi:hypothetical protein